MEEKTSGWWLLENVSGQSYGQQVDDLILWMHVFMIVLFVGWGIFYLFAVFKFRARKGHEASAEPAKAPFNKYLEIGVVVFEVVLLVGFSIPAWNEFKGDFPAAEESETIRVVGKQFAWVIHYPGKDGIFGKSRPDLASAENNIGLDRDGDPNAADDIVALNNMYIPIEKPIIARISSLDVIHSFGVPNLRVKQDAVPGMEIPVWFEGVVEGTYEIACSQLCGNLHSAMRGFLHIKPQAEYDAWLEEQHADTPKGRAEAKAAKAAAKAAEEAAKAAATEEDDTGSDAESGDETGTE